ncbi:MAG: ATP-grasp domain-containing protein [Syntrophaceae bacterium]|nr:ATP-grasp domain-containing protein [Syntrophaceae bacterium]
MSRLLAPIYDVHFGDADSDAKPFSLAAEQWHRIPLATAPDFVSGVVSLCKHLDVDLVIPTVDEELLPFARGIRSQGLDVLLPPEDFVEIHLNKLTSNRFLRGKGLPVPKTEPCDGKQRVDFPCIVKPLSGRGSRNVALVNSEQELQAHILLTKMLAQDFIVQERVAGQEYTVMMTADRTGRLRAVVPVFVERKRGITLRAYTDRDEQVIAACSAIHAAFPVPGCYNIQLIKTATGKVMPFEINPRISTTTCLGLAAGVNFIDIYLRRGDLTESEPSKLLDFQDRLYLRRSWYNEFRY